MGYGILDTEYGIWGCGTWDSGLLDIVKISKPGKNEAGNANGGTRSERVHYTSTTQIHISARHWHWHSYSYVYIPVSGSHLHPLVHSICSARIFPPNPLSICESVFPCFSSHISTYSPMWSIGRAKDYEFSLWPTIRVASLANAPRLRISPEPFAFLFNY